MNSGQSVRGRRGRRARRAHRAGGRLRERRLADDAVDLWHCVVGHRRSRRRRRRSSTRRSQKARAGGLAAAPDRRAGERHHRGVRRRRRRTRAAAARPKPNSAVPRQVRVLERASWRRPRARVALVAGDRARAVEWARRAVSTLETATPTGSRRRGRRGRSLPAPSTPTASTRDALRVAERSLAAAQDAPSRASAYRAASAWRSSRSRSPGTASGRPPRPRVGRAGARAPQRDLRSRRRTRTHRAEQSAAADADGIWRNECRLSRRWSDWCKQGPRLGPVALHGALRDVAHRRDLDEGEPAEELQVDELGQRRIERRQALRARRRAARDRPRSAGDVATFLAAREGQVAAALLRAAMAHVVDDEPAHGPGRVAEKAVPVGNPGRRVRPARARLRAAASSR